MLNNPDEVGIIFAFGPIKMIGIISDTHENMFAAKEAAEVFRQRKVDFVVHCGDMISPPMLADFRGLKMRIIFGNCDGERQGLQETAKALGFEQITDEKEFDYQARKFYVCHGKDKRKLEESIKSQKYDYILTGHTHELSDERVGKTRIINPGGVGLRETDKFIGLLDPEKDTLEIVRIGAKPESPLSALQHT